ncbi:MAG: carboxymuconolactone decarboxylase family protein [Thermoleophilia bacterium]
MTHVRTETADTLRGISAGDPSVLDGLLGARGENLQDSGLGAREHALATVAALIAVDAPPASFVAHVAAALDAGATPEDLLGVLIAVSPQVGMPKVVAAAPELMLALGLVSVES